ncbi:MAG: diguanylate cyclase, partial [Acidimicrobiales bacterium]
MSERAGETASQTQLLAVWKDRCRAKGVDPGACSGRDSLFLVAALSTALRSGSPTAALGRSARTWGANFSSPAEALAALSVLREVALEEAASQPPEEAPRTSTVGEATSQTMEATATTSAASDETDDSSSPVAAMVDHLSRAATALACVVSGETPPAEADDAAQARRGPDAAEVAVGTVLAQVMAEAVDAASATLRAQARTDPLTGCANRFALDEDLARAVNSAARSGLDVAVGVVDLDGLKKINDSRGHMEGDRALRDLVTNLRSELRDADTLYRTGGDEFVLIAPFADASGVAAMLGRASAPEGPRFSWGAASLESIGRRALDEPQALVSAADADLYLRRRNSRGPTREESAVAGSKAAVVSMAAFVTSRANRHRAALASIAAAVVLAIGTAFALTDFLGNGAVPAGRAARPPHATPGSSTGPSSSVPGVQTPRPSTSPSGSSAPHVSVPGTTPASAQSSPSVGSRQALGSSFAGTHSVTTAPSTILAQEPSHPVAPTTPGSTPPSSKPPNTTPSPTIPPVSVKPPTSKPPTTTPPVTTPPVTTPPVTTPPATTPPPAPKPPAPKPPAPKPLTPKPPASNPTPPGPTTLDLQGQNLQGRSFQNADLAGANFSGANMQGDNLQNSD